MEDDDGYQRFFSYISLFTFSMLMLVMSNNFLQLFFGCEAVGLVSYLLIGFWYKKPSAIHANMKAFLVNRVGDFGFILGIGLVVAHTGSLGYTEAFAAAPALSPWNPFNSYRAKSGHSLRWPASVCSLVQWANLPSSPCMSGCQTPWRGPHRSRP